MRLLEHIVIIDDSNEDNEFHEIAIQEANVAKKITCILKPENAIEFLKKSLAGGDGNAVFPELIFIDTQMPRIDGFELLGILKQLLAKHERAIPEFRVFMLTGAYNPAIEFYLNNPGYTFVSGYILKPLTKKMLLELVEKNFETY